MTTPELTPFPGDWVVFVGGDDENGHAHFVGQVRAESWFAHKPCFEVDSLVGLQHIPNIEPSTYMVYPEEIVAIVPEPLTPET